MSAEDFERFRHRVIDSPELQRGLREIDDWVEFTQAVAREASTLGLVVEADDIDQARRAARRTWLERWIP